MATIRFLPSADAKVVSAHSRDVIRAVLEDAGLDACLITSTVRTPAAQARAMVNNLESAGVAAQRKLYADPGRKVIGEYERAKARGESRTAVIESMTNRILAIGPGKVSRHCADPSELNVVDIAPSSIGHPERFVAALERALQRKAIRRFFAPAHGDPAFHLEIPQPVGMQGPTVR